MGKVAIAGGSSNLAREIIDKILDRGTYEVTILSRGPTTESLPKGLCWKVVDYGDKAALVEVLKEFDTVLSFALAHTDVDVCIANQKTLIDACIEAGVKRFAPSEWATRSGNSVDFYKPKDAVREYLEQINTPTPVIEYCLFQPGQLTNYLAVPYKTTQHLATSPVSIDFANRRAITVDGIDYAMVLTTVEDIGRMVAAALDYTGRWPTRGGIVGTRVTFTQLVALGEKLRGAPFAVECFPKQSFEDDTFAPSWMPLVSHPHVSVDDPVLLRLISRGILRMFMLAYVRGDWDVSDEWNQLLPEVKMESAEAYLTKIWTGKP